MHTVMLAFLFGSSVHICSEAPHEPQINPEARRLFELPLSSFEDSCQAYDETEIRHVRFATLDAAGQVEDHLELRMTTWAPDRSAFIVEYIVNGAVLWIHNSVGEVSATDDGWRMLTAPDGGKRAARLLAAFAAAHPRIVAADVESWPTCGATAGKSEESGKCAMIGVLGCLSSNALVCGVSASLAVLCAYLVEKTCDADPDSCQPGWTEG